MKKFTVVFLLIASLFTLSACGGIKNDTEEEVVKTFLQAAMIDGDSETLKEVYVGNRMSTEEIIFEFDGALTEEEIDELELDFYDEDRVRFGTPDGFSLDMSLELYEGKYYITNLR